MNIKAEKFILEMTHDEMWDLAFCVFGKIESSLKNHWVLHQSVWQDNEKKNLALLHSLFNSLGRVDIYENIYKEADKIFKEFNEKKPI